MNAHDIRSQVLDYLVNCGVAWSDYDIDGVVDFIDAELGDADEFGEDLLSAALQNNEVA